DRTAKRLRRAHRRDRRRPRVVGGRSEDASGAAQSDQARAPRCRVLVMAMQNPLLQQIDAIAKEKGVEPDVIIGAVQDAIEAAARKRYKNETLRARFNTETGQIELCAVKRIVEEVTDPPNQISLAEAQQLYGDEAEVDMEIEFPRPTEDLGRIAAQTA